MDPHDIREADARDVPARVSTVDAHAPRSSRSSSTRTWREGSRTARPWDVQLLAWAALCVGAGAIASVLVRTLMPDGTGALLGAFAVWAGIAAPVVIAFRRSRPRGLLGFRPVDILYGVVIGVVLRVAEGWLSVAAGAGEGFPSYPLVDGRLPDLWWLGALIGPVLIAPVVEEFLFRGVIVVTVYRLARRGLDGAALAVVASTAFFVAMHAITGMSSWAEPASLALVAIACALLVLLTGRIWGAVLVHVVFNATAVGLALVGTFLG